MAIVEIVTPPATKALSTVARVREQLAGGPADVSDTLLGIWIGQASDAITGYLRRELARARVKEMIEGEQWRHIALERAPLVTVHSVTVNDTPLTAEQWEIASPWAATIRLKIGYTSPLYDDRLDHGYGLSSRRRLDRYLIDYTAGWLLPGDPSADMPQALEMALVETIRSLGIRRSANPLVTSERLGDAAWTYGKGEAGTGAASVLPPEAIALLAPWKAVG